jgi:hypothetical protein
MYRATTGRAFAVLPRRVTVRRVQQCFVYGFFILEIDRLVAFDAGGE